MPPAREMLLPVIFLYLRAFTSTPVGADNPPDSDVSIEDFIDLDGETPMTYFRDRGMMGSSHSVNKNINHVIASRIYPSSPVPPFRSSSSSSSSLLSSSASPTSLPFSSPSASFSSSPGTATPKTGTTMSNVIFDDEDIFISGSGSGSGDFHPENNMAEAFPENGRLTPTSKTSSTPMTTRTVETSTAFTGDVKMARELSVVSPKDKGENPGNNNNNNNNNNNDLFVEDDDDLYDNPEGHRPVVSNHVIAPAKWGPWSSWVNAGRTSRIRVRSCQVKGQEVTEKACEGVTMQMKTCDSHSGQCSKATNVTDLLLPGCDQSDQNRPQDGSIRVPPPSPRVPDAPPPTKARPNPEECFYSLFDNFRQKFVFTRWNLTALITKSKVKRWCDKKSGQYLLMSTPLDHCKRYYKDLCKVTQRCRVTRSLTDAGDFAEGCWRSHVYGERLPVGLSNKQMKTFFICQRFAPSGRAGMTFGYKQAYFTTIYDIVMRTPVISLVKLTTIGDDIWPETDYFIEHSLVDYDTSMLWRYQKKPKKGMLTLGDLDRCPDDQGCDLGQRQVLPEDYLNSFPEDNKYVLTHLIWPDLMPSEPSHRLATFTLTNMAPMLKTLYTEWRATVHKVRQFALKECQIPYNLDLNVNQPGQMSTHRSHQSALYIASGALPNLDPVVTTGHDVHVPFLFWMAGCCVQHHAQESPSMEASTTTANSSSSNTNVHMTWENDLPHDGGKTNVSAFAVYISNAAGSGVIAAPVLQLEMLLQDVYKVDHDLDDVKLFPGDNSVCNELRNDVSGYFQ